jgi:hypothetical protein
MNTIECDICCVYIKYYKPNSYLYDLYSEGLVFETAVSDINLYMNRWKERKRNMNTPAK